MVRITADDLAKAPVIEGFIADEAGEWGGVGEAYDLGGSEILASTHLARYALDGVSKEYFGGLMSLKRRGDKVKVVAQKIVACRQCFPKTPAKSPKLEKIFYQTGMSIKSDEVEVWGGVSDFTVGSLAVGAAWL